VTFTDIARTSCAAGVAARGPALGCRRRSRAHRSGCGCRRRW
jgi:hypothetical protein